MTQSDEVSTHANWVSYCSSVMTTMTPACTNLCLYCGFSRADSGLLTPEKMESLFYSGAQNACSCAYLLSGEDAQHTRSVHRELAEHHYHSYESFVEHTAIHAMSRGLLPVLDIGVISERDMVRLSQFAVAFTLSIENISEKFGRVVHPKKNIKERIEALCIAGKHQIPCNSGLLIGLGESAASRRHTIDKIAEIHSHYDNIQSLLIRKYTQEHGTHHIAHSIGMQEIAELTEYANKNLPNVLIQVQPHIMEGWAELLNSGVNDLGVIGVDADPIQPSNRWLDTEIYEWEAMGVDHSLRPRLPITQRFIQKGWVRKEVETVLEKLLQREEFAWYADEITDV